MFNPIIGSESLTLFLPTLNGKRVIFTHCLLPWVFCPLSIHITMLLISFVLEISDTKYIAYPLTFLDCFKVRSKVLV